jgi:hypothetical protein
MCVYVSHIHTHVYVCVCARVCAETVGTQMSSPSFHASPTLNLQTLLLPIDTADGIKEEGVDIERMEVHKESRPAPKEHRIFLPYGTYTLEAQCEEPKCHSVKIPNIVHSAEAYVGLSDDLGRHEVRLERNSLGFVIPQKADTDAKSALITLSWGHFPGADLELCLATGADGGDEGLVTTEKLGCLPKPIKGVTAVAVNASKLGLKWENAGKTKPAKTREISNPELETALVEGKTEFTLKEWDGFGIFSLKLDNCIKAGDFYFMPAGKNEGFGPQIICITQPVNFKAKISVWDKSGDPEIFHKCNPIVKIWLHTGLFFSFRPSFKPGDTKMPSPSSWNVCDLNVKTDKKMEAEVCECAVDGYHNTEILCSNSQHTGMT